ncbi:hypothetical protein ACNRBS_15670 [Ralstonia pseudosolanacearum]|uniref:hypothetical protein n=1 Tax=Ralstonia pseudosolanacearum TaxID=1310165 RepID=UPI0018A58F67|nr:hypothetical protein [Ralstonia pseudosolanacearum]BCL92894.1 hypothetical protein MAFF211479_25950 [Ralstonia solanacearum]BCN05460.1 hypothetical protein RPSB_25970 [Ralstonia solanacearum]
MQLKMFAALCSVLFASTIAVAQEKHVVSFDAPASGNKYTQQHILEVGDVPEHKLRLYELVRSYGGKDQTIEGVVLKEAVIRATSDLTDLNGLGRSYVEYRMENGDKIFARGYFLNHKLQGSDRLKNLTELDITGGTGKFRGIRGIVRAETVADSKSFNQNRTEFEYWFEK